MTLRLTALLWVVFILFAAYVGAHELSIAIGLTDPIPPAVDLTP